VHDHSGGLVDDDQLRVLVYDVERDRFGRRELDGSGRLRWVELYNITFASPVGGAGRPAIERDAALAEEARGGGAAEVPDLLGEQAIDAAGRPRHGQLHVAARGRKR
jgi:hypothetical protein